MASTEAPFPSLSLQIPSSETKIWKLQLILSFSPREKPQSILCLQPDHRERKTKSNKLQLQVAVKVHWGGGRFRNTKLINMQEDYYPRYISVFAFMELPGTSQRASARICRSFLGMRGLNQTEMGEISAHKPPSTEGCRGKGQAVREMLILGWFIVCWK